LAGPGEILVSDGAMKLVPSEKFKSEKVSYKVSGLSVEAHRIKY